MRSETVIQILADVVPTATIVASKKVATSAAFHVIFYYRHDIKYISCFNSMAVLTAVEVRAWMNNYIGYKVIYMITFAFLNLTLTMLAKNLTKCKYVIKSNNYVSKPSTILWLMLIIVAEWIQHIHCNLYPDSLIHNSYSKKKTLSHFQSHIWLD